MREIFRSVSSREPTKEAIPDIVRWLSEHEDKSAQDAIDSLGLEFFQNKNWKK